MQRGAQLGRWAALAALTAVVAAPCGAAQSERVVWKPVPMALLRVDDAPPKTWQVFRAVKRKQFILVQIGARFLLLDVQTKRVFDLAASSLTRKGDALDWDDPGDSPAPNSSAEKTGTTGAAQSGSSGTARTRPANELLPSDDWTMRDVGRMLRIRLRLTAEGRDFDVQIPIQPDLRQFY